MGKKNLTELLAGLGASNLSSIAVDVTGVSQDSSSVKNGELFLACAGSRGSHGIAYGGEAAKNGAIAIAWEPTDELNSMPEQFTVNTVTAGTQSIPLIAVENLHLKSGEIAARFFADPSVNMEVTGVTGTNGKTSIVFFIAQCLSNKQPCGVLGTIGNGLFDKDLENIKASSHTTADAVIIQKMMAEMYIQGAKQIAMEVSSHALDQGRVNGVKFDLGIFTNLSRDHLDYHGGMEDYAAAKRKLFLQHKPDTAIVNYDDREGRKIIAELTQAGQKVLSYSVEAQTQADLQAMNLCAGSDGMQFDFCMAGRCQTIKISLMGDFNVSNVLATAGALRALGYQFEEIVELLQKLQSVPGRMELIAKQQQPGGQVIVDYAHTPDALEKALRALRAHIKESGNGDIWCVFGCGGNRDKGKRPQMGKIVEQYAEHIILTNDNPRFEEPLEIIKDIEMGLSPARKYHVEIDRKKAITMAIESSRHGDIVLVAGKGHESYQEVKGVKNYFCDRQVVYDYYKSLSQ